VTNLKAIMNIYSTAKILLLASVVAGCASGTGGVVQIGPDMYMVGGQGRYTDLSGSAVKARFFEDAGKYCSQLGRVMVPTGSTGQDAGFGTYASAEVQFRCAEKR
jgi:hypothetical protein